MGCSHMDFIVLNSFYIYFVWNLSFSKAWMDVEFGQMLFLHLQRWSCCFKYYGLWCPLDCKEIQPVHSKADQSWVFIGGTDVEAETLILWPPDAKSWLTGKDPDAGKDWGQEEKGMTEDEMVRWHHWLNGHGCGCTLEVVDGQGGLASCGSWVAKSWTWLRDWTEPASIVLNQETIHCTKFENTKRYEE